MSQLSFLEHLKESRRALTVSELTAQIKQLLEDQFFDVWVEGEVSNYRSHSSGHWYFSLKDGFASIRCASFRMQNRLIRFRLTDGLKVRARGRLSVYEARGEYQLIVEYLEPAGAGALQLAFEQLKARLAAEGLFEPDRKRPLPLLPRCVGVVTSPSGAAIRDILRIIRRRNEAVSVLIAPARVQGEGSAQEIARAIRTLSSRREVDVIIVGRGGGSTEDLWSFNEEPVARAIATSRVPVISAVGHETDFTIADFVADFRASTPSAAAELVTKARDEMCHRVASLSERMAGAARYRLLSFRSRLAELESSRAFHNVLSRARATSQRFDDAVYAMETALRRVIKESRARHEAFTARLREQDVRRVLDQRCQRLNLASARLEPAVLSFKRRAQDRLALAAGKLETMSPLAVLARGYAIAFDSYGHIIKRADDVAKGERLRVRVAQGEMNCIKE